VAGGAEGIRRAGAGVTKVRLTITVLDQMLDSIPADGPILVVDPSGAQTVDVAVIGAPGGSSPCQDAGR
jgi:hypothetical protein